MSKIQCSVCRNELDQTGPYGNELTTDEQVLSANFSHLHRCRNVNCLKNNK